MSDLKTVVTQMQTEGAFRKLLFNPLSQFGPATRQYLGPTLLPERLVPNNKFSESTIKYRTVIANDGTRYSPSQKKGNDIVGSMDVNLTDQDIAAEYTAEEYDTHLAIANVNSLSGNAGNPTMAGVASLTNWFDTRIVRALQEKSEKQRFEALVDASVPILGDNGYSDTVTYPNPSGHRVAAGGSWASDAYDPFDDIFAMLNFAEGKGYSIAKIMVSRPVLFALLNNDKVKAAVGGYINVTGGALVSNTARVTREGLNGYLSQSGLPAIQTYDLQYRTQTGTDYFLKRNVMLMVAATGRDETLDLGDNQYLPVRDVLGYQAIGRAAGQLTAGRAMNMEMFTKKPPRVEAEGWQTSLPVVTDPEAVYVINGITTS